MSSLLWLVSWVALIAGLAFFIAGAMGLWRFPDLYSRLHAVAMTDTVGFGLISLGLIARAESWPAMLLLIFIWLLVMASSATIRQLLARYGEGGHPHMGEHKVDERS